MAGGTRARGNGQRRGRDGAEVRALAYPALTGGPKPGDRVLLNTTRAGLGLGTGGYALVVAVPDRLPPDRSGPGHLVKARYTPLQAWCWAPTSGLAVPRRAAGRRGHRRDAGGGGRPALRARPPSWLALCARTAARAGPRRAGCRPGPDSALRASSDDRRRGAAGLVLSTCAALREAGWLAGTVAVGQAFGGDLEAVTLHTGLLAARHVLGADVAVVAQGPGNLGTGTR